MGLFNRLRRVFERKYSPAEALQYLREESNIFLSKEFNDSDFRQIFKNQFLRFAKNLNSNMTKQEVDNLAKKVYDICKNRLTHTSTFSQNDYETKSQDRRGLKEFFLRLTICFEKHNSSVQKEIRTSKELIRIENFSRNDWKIDQRVNIVIREIQILKNDLIKTINEHYKVNYDYKKSIIKQFNDEFNNWDLTISNLKKEVFEFRNNPNNRQLRLNVELIFDQLSKKINHFEKKIKGFKKIQENIQKNVIKI